MEAKLVGAIPKGTQWHYEPKWDGFRCLAFRDGSRVELQSKAGESLTRYFPELVAALAKLKARQFILDGEIILVIDGKLSFDDLLQRIHPAESRVQKLSKSHPVQFVAFDILAGNGKSSWMEVLFESRRQALEEFAASQFEANGMLRLSPATSEVATARHWLKELRGQLDGLVAKRLDLPYLPGERAMQKIKNLRTADCVVGGFRYLASQRLVGSLLLGLYDSGGLLHHVGFTSSIAVKDRAKITKKLEALIEKPGFTGRSPGGPSRWSTAKSSEWEPLRLTLVVEVVYDHFTGHRFRHGTKLLRWRPDKAPGQCLLKQVEKESRSPFELLKESA